MGYTTLSAHYDGKQVLFDEPVKLEPDTKLLVTVLPKDEVDEMRWFSLSSLSRAYSKDEPEYSTQMIKEPNAEYKP